MKEILFTGPVTVCQICSSKNIVPILALGNQPIVQAYLTPAKLNAPEVTYPLNVVQCKSCGLLQLDYIVPPAIVFPRNYPYRTGLTNMLIRNFQSLAEKMISQYQLAPGSLVVDIGSNDGTLLSTFKARGMRVVGIEPTDAARIANKNKISTIQGFFSKSIASSLVKKHGKAQLITATNVFAHINNVSELMGGINHLLDTNGIFVSESQYFFDTFEKLEFDCIYHEHLRFYTLKPLLQLLSMEKLTAIDVERISAAGGSLRVFAMKGKRQQKSTVQKLVAEETRVGLYNTEILRAWASRVIDAKLALINLLISCKKNGAHIAGLGAPARANTLLGFTHIDNNFLDYTCEKDVSPKIGMITPGTHILIAPETRLIQEQPKYLLILSWHIGDELMKIIRKAGYRGTFIVPLPVPHLVKNI